MRPSSRPRGLALAALWLLGTGATLVAASPDSPAHGPRVAHEQADAQGQAAAAYALARHYSGLTGEAVDTEKAATYLRQAAEAGHVPAQVDLAYMHLNGWHRVPKDLAAAHRWFKAAAQGGSPQALCALGDFHYHGWGGVRQDARQAVRLYRQTASGDAACAANSQYALFRAYAAGNGVPKDMKHAIGWLQQAAEAGHPRAQRALGRAYDRGEGVTRDPALARLWLRKSREGVAPHDDHDHDLPSLAGPALFKKLAPFSSASSVGGQP